MTHTQPIKILPLLTTILWFMTLTVGILGLRIPYPRAHPASLEPEIPPTQIITADLPPPTPVPAPVAPPPDAVAPSPQLAAPAPLPAPIAPPPAAPAITPVAPPSAAIAFSVPVEGLTKIVDINSAAHVLPSLAAPTQTARGPSPAPPPPQPLPAAPPTPPPITHLTLGEGEGRQPPPTYPREAALAHQQGTVTIRFNVGEDGHIQSAEIISPSYPLLNQEALRTIREKWLFPPGPKRIYEVPIQFQLK